MVKKALKDGQRREAPWKQTLPQIFLQYQLIVHHNTGVSPSLLLSYWDPCNDWSLTSSAETLSWSSQPTLSYNIWTYNDDPGHAWMSEMDHFWSLGSTYILCTREWREKMEEIYGLLYWNVNALQPGEKVLPVDEMDSMDPDPPYYNDTLVTWIFSSSNHLWT